MAQLAFDTMGNPAPCVEIDFPSIIIVVVVSRKQQEKRSRGNRWNSLRELNN